MDFFFVLSGFLITTLLLREERSSGRPSLADFYWRRALRILPVYWLVVTSVSVYYVLIKNEAQYADLVPFYYLFLSNYLVGDIPTLGPTWSLSVEEQYYLVWPLLFVMLPLAGRNLLPAAALGLNLLGAIGVLADFGFVIEWGPVVIHPTYDTYAAIFIGSGLALLLDAPKGFKMLYGILSHRWAPIVAFACLIILLQMTPEIMRGAPALAMHLVMALCLASLVVREDNSMANFLRLRPIARVGEISYGIYLYHLLALHVANTIFGWTASATITLIYIGISFLVAEVSFRTYERFFRGFRHKRPRRLVSG